MYMFFVMATALLGTRCIAYLFLHLWQHYLMKDDDIYMTVDVLYIWILCSMPNSIFMLEFAFYKFFIIIIIVYFTLFCPSSDMFTSAAFYFWLLEKLGCGLLATVTSLTLAFAPDTAWADGSSRPPDIYITCIVIHQCWKWMSPIRLSQSPARWNYALGSGSSISFVLFACAAFC